MEKKEYKINTKTKQNKIDIYIYIYIQSCKHLQTKVT